MTERDERVIHLPPSPQEQAAIDAARDALQAEPDEARALRDRLDQLDPPTVQGAHQRRRRRAGIAAMAVAAAAAMAVALVAGQRLRTGEEPVVQMLVETDTDQNQVVSPAAGIDVDVAAGSRIDLVVDRNNEARIELADGSIAVDFQPSSEVSTMRVVAGSVTVDVVGTRFVVTRRSDDVMVTVEEGAVEVTWSGNVVAVAQGETWRTRAVQQVVEVLPEMVPATVEPGRITAEPAEATAPARAETPRAVPDDPARTSGAESTPADPDATLLARIEINRAAGLDAADRQRDLDRFLKTYPDSDHVEEVLALQVEALAELGDDAGVMQAAARFIERFPDGARRREVRWIEATVARDRLHDCGEALPAYRELAAEPWGRWAEASYFRGLCAAEQGHHDEARQALTAALEGGLDEDRSAEAERVLQQIPGT